MPKRKYTIPDLLDTYDVGSFDDAMAALRDEASDGVVSTPCPDGCQVEPDGECPHGHPSWLVILGFC